MKILLINQYYLPDTAATGQLLGDAAAELTARGHEVHVVCSRGSYGGNRFFPAEETIAGAAVHRLGATGFGRAGRAGRILDYLSFYVLAAARCRRLPRMDVCLCLTTPPFIGLVAAGLSRLRHTPLVHWTMDLYPQIAAALGVIRPGSRIERIFARASRSVYSRSKRIVSLGDTMTRALENEGVDTGAIRVVHNWVPAEAVACTPPPDDDAVTILYSGNMGLGHNLDAVLAAIALLDDRSALRVVFAGDGKCKRALQDRAAALELSCAEFRPPCALDRLSARLAAGDVHVVSQKTGTEGFIVPSKIYGVMAAGRPAVYIGPAGTEVDDIVRTSGCGISVAPGDTKAIAAAFEQLIASRERRQAMGRAGRTYYEQHFGAGRGPAAVADIVEEAARN